MPPTRTTRRIRRIALCIVGSALLVAAPAASGAAWTIAGPLAAPTTAVLGGAPADTPTVASLSYDPATQALVVRLDFSAPPSRNPIGMQAGTAQPNGTCVPNGLSIAIAAQDHMVTTTTTQTTQTWIPPRTEIGWSYSSRYPPGSGAWTYLGYDSWTMRHQWLHAIPGSWVQESHDITSSGPDPALHERTAGLSLAAADGVLADTAVVANDSATLTWTFTSPLLETVPATCIAVNVANRRSPFLLVPITAPRDAGAAPGSAVDGVSAATAPQAHARAAGRMLHLRLQGRAGAIQVRIGRRSTPPLPYAEALSLRLGARTPALIAVRFKTGAKWSPWQPVPVAPEQRRR